MNRTIDFRFYAMRNGADFCELYAVGDPKITMDSTGSIKTKFSGSFMVPGEDVDWLSDEIKPVMIIDGVYYNLGRFLPATISESDDGVTKQIKVDAYDRSWIVRDTKTETVLYFASGTNYINAISSVLATCGITIISATETSATLADDREDWDIGTSCLDIVNQLLGEINYKDLWFDSDGVAILEPRATPTADNIDHVLDENNIESLLIPGISKQTDIFSQPNVFICVCSNADKSSGMVATAENTNPQSPLSIARRGRRISAVYNVDNIASQAALQLYADRMVTDSLMRGEVIDVTTGLLPGYGVGDVIGLKYGDIMGICEESRWTMPLKVGGQMSHTLNRVVMNLV